MLGAVQEERPAAQEPSEQQHGEHDRERKPGGLREEDERERGQHCGREEGALTWTGDVRATEQRSEREAEPNQTAQERHPPDEAGRRGHRALADAAVAAGERPEALACDHNAVGASHPAEARQVGGPVGLSEHGEDCGAIHPDKDRAQEAARQVPGGLGQQRVGPRRLPAAAAKEPQQQEHQHDDQDDPKDSHS